MRFTVYSIAALAMANLVGCGKCDENTSFADDEECYCDNHPADDELCGGECTADTTYAEDPSCFCDEHPDASECQLCPGFADAQAETFSEGVIYVEADSLEETGDCSLYAFSATEGNFYVVWTGGYTAEGGNPDTVLQIFDSTEAMIGENDDQPYRWGNTDSGVIFRARSTGTYYAKVIEWADWAGEPGSFGDGDFDFVAYEWTEGELLDVNASGNDTIEVCEDALDTLDDSDTTNNLYMQYVMPIADFYGQGFGWSPGDISTATDVDYFGFRATPDTGYTGELLQIGMYPDADTDWDAHFVLVDSEGNVLADGSADPEITPDYPFFYDSGITYPFGPSGGDVFLEVKDASGGSGDSHWYNFVTVSYPATFIDGATSTIQVVVETVPAGVSTAHMTAGTGTFNFGRVSGFLNDDDTDGTDVWQVIAPPVASGGVFNITADVESAGSLISDLKIELFDADPTTGTPTALTSDTGLNPVITDYNLPATVSNTTVWVKVTSVSGAEGFYNLLITVE